MGTVVVSDDDDGDDWTVREGGDDDEMEPPKSRGEDPRAGGETAPGLSERAEFSTLGELTAAARGIGEREKKKKKKRTTTKDRQTTTAEPGTRSRHRVRVATEDADSAALAVAMPTPSSSLDVERGEGEGEQRQKAARAKRIDVQWYYRAGGAKFFAGCLGVFSEWERRIRRCRESRRLATDALIDDEESCAFLSRLSMSHLADPRISRSGLPS